MTRKKQDTVTSLSARAARASFAIDDALASFVKVADDLETAAAEHEAVISESNTEISRLVGVQAAARSRADQATSAATKIRDLVS